MASNDSVSKTLIVALSLCLVCSVFVATATVMLKPRQAANQVLEKRKNILIAGNLMKEGDKTADVEKLFNEKISLALIDVKTGEIVSPEGLPEVLQPAQFDIKTISKDPAVTVPVSAAEDIAGIKSKPTHMLIYQIKEKDGVAGYVFPIYGKGLWSTMYGMMALDRDLKTVRGLTFYEHGETPGLGGEVDNPRWKSLWKGKQAFSDSHEWTLRVLKGVAPADSNCEIDGLSGATITTRGVNNLVRFWFGQGGYAAFLDKLRKEGANE